MARVVANCEENEGQYDQGDVESDQRIGRPPRNSTSDEKGVTSADGPFVCLSSHLRILAPVPFCEDCQQT